MAFTRYHDDLSRIEKSLIESTYAGIYHLNTPGNQLNYVDDLHVRLQRWGGNLQTNPFEVNNELRGATRHLKKEQDVYRHPNTISKQYNTTTFMVDETRASCPAWTFRDDVLPQGYRHQHLWVNPQANVEYKFDNNRPSRMLEKDYYKSPYYS